jgi:hypothetical protein
VEGVASAEALGCGAMSSKGLVALRRVVPLPVAFMLVAFWCLVGVLDQSRIPRAFVRFRQ